MRLLLAVALAMFIAAPARAMLAPQYYERARDTAPNVVVIEVAHVDVPPSSEGHGDCTVSGRVAVVERGTRYQVGQAVSVIVPCLRNTQNLPIGGVMWKSISSLLSAHWGRAFLNGAGGLALYQYDVLRARP